MPTCSPICWRPIAIRPGESNFPPRPRPTSRAPSCTHSWARGGRTRRPAPVRSPLLTGEGERSRSAKLHILLFPWCGHRSKPFSILEWIEYVGARHHDRERGEPVLDRNRAGVVGEHVGQAAIGLRRLIEVAADQVYALLAQPRLHLVVAHAAELAHLLAGRRILADAAARLGARHHAAGAVHGRVQARGRRLPGDAVQDHGIVAHRAADETALAREGRRRALAHDPQIALAVALAPSVVVM